MARRKSDITARKRKIEEEIAQIEATLPELEEKARQAEERFKELHAVLNSSDRSHNPELKRRHKAWQEAEDELAGARARIRALETELSVILAPVTARERRDRLRALLEKARERREKAARAVERLEARLEALEGDIRETDGRMQAETRAARMAALEGRDHDLDALLEARERLERLKVERKAVSAALEDARRMWERAGMTLSEAASELRQAEGEVALHELADLLRDHRDIVARIDATPGANADRVMAVFDQVLREE